MPPAFIYIMRAKTGREIIILRSKYIPSVLKSASSISQIHPNASKLAKIINVIFKTAFCIKKDKKYSYL